MRVHCISSKWKLGGYTSSTFDHSTRICCCSMLKHVHVHSTIHHLFICGINLTLTSLVLALASLQWVDHPYSVPRKHHVEVWTGLLWFIYYVCLYYICRDLWASAKLLWQEWKQRKWRYVIDNVCLECITGFTVTSESIIQHKAQQSAVWGWRPQPEYHKSHIMCFIVTLTSCGPK